MTIMHLSVSRRLVTVLLPGIFLALVALPRPVLADCVKIRADLRQEKGLIKRHKILKEAIKKCPQDPKITYFFAYNLERLRKYDQARELYHRAVELDPDFARSWFGLGEMYLAAGDPHNAIQALEKGLSIEPANIWARRSLKQAQQEALEREKSSRPSLAVGRGSEEGAGPLTGANGEEKTVSRTPTGLPREQIRPPEEKEPPPPAGQDTYTDPDQVAVDDQVPALQSPPALADLPPAAATGSGIQRGDKEKPLPPHQAKATTPTPKTAPDTPERKEPEKMNRIVVRSLTEEEIVGFMEMHPSQENSDLTADNASLRMPIQFERNSGELTDEARKIIDQVICPALKNDRLAGAVYELSGHTDDRGDFDTNMYLSRIRVNAVRDYLVADCGIHPARLRVVYYGPTRPLVPNTSTVNRRLNRRVEIRRLQ
ncbi:OmpA family protein [Desulfolithobacter sp.]